MTSPHKFRTATLMGKLGLPAPLKELSQQRWDAIIVGGGHNGLTCATYLTPARPLSTFIIFAGDSTRTISEPEYSTPGLTDLQANWPVFSH